MTPDILIKQAHNFEWQYIDGEDGREDVIRWKTFAGADNDSTNGISFGVCELPSGAKLQAHQHAPPELYYVTEGSGEVLLENEVQSVSPGSIVYLPPYLEHGIRNTGQETLTLFWMFPVDRWSNVEYHMLERPF
ncbi:MAG: cupin domain-containing protein [Pseudomonadota bacterium]